MSWVCCATGTVAANAQAEIVPPIYSQALIKGRLDGDGNPARLTPVDLSPWHKMFKCSPVATALFCVASCGGRMDQARFSARAVQQSCLCQGQTVKPSCSSDKVVDDLYQQLVNIPNNDGFWNAYCEERHG